MRYAILLVPLLLFLSACGGGEEAQPTPTPSPAVARPSPTPEPTPTAPTGPRVIDTITIGAGVFASDALAVNTSTNGIYVTGGESVAVIDGNTNEITDVVALEGRATDVAVNPETNRIYVSIQGEKMQVIDGNTNAVISSIPVQAERIAVNHVTNRIYVSSGNGLSVVDGQNNEIIATIPDLSGDIAVNPATNRIYVSNRFSVSPKGQQTWVIDGETNETIAIIPTAWGALAVNPVTNRVYVARDGESFSEPAIISVIDGESNAIVETLRQGRPSPRDIAVNPSTNLVYLTGSGGGPGGGTRLGLTVIDGATGEVISFTLPERGPSSTLPERGPSRLAVNPVTNRVYAISPGDNSIRVIDDDTNSVIASVRLGLRPTAVAVDPGAGRIYIGTQFGDALLVADPISRVVVDRIAFGLPLTAGGPEGTSLAVNPRNHRVYAVVSHDGGSFGSDVVSIDGETKAVIKTVVSREEPFLALGRVAVDDQINRVYVAYSGSELGEGPTLFVINGDTDEAAASVTVQGSVLAAARNRIYLTNAADGISIMGGQSLEVIAVVAVGDRPCSVAVNSDTDRIFVGICRGSVVSGSVAIIDTATNDIITTVTVGTQPAAIAVNPETNRIYVANRDSDTVSVIDGHTNTVIATLDVGVQPVDIAVDPTTNRIYVANSENDTITVIEDAGG